MMYISFFYAPLPLLWALRSGDHFISSNLSPDEVGKKMFKVKGDSLKLRYIKLRHGDGLLANESIFKMYQGFDRWNTDNYYLDADHNGVRAFPSHASVQQE